MFRNRKFRNLLLTILVIGVILIVIGEIFPIFNSEQNLFTSYNLARALFLLALLLFVSLTFFAKGTLKESFEKIKAGLLWVVIFFIIIFGYAFRHELEEIKRRVISVLVPSYVWVEEGEIVIARHNDGHFYLNALANDKVSIKFLIDTGASGVAITKQDAINMKFDLNKLNYNQRYSTANGIVYSAPIKIKKLQIGKKVLYNVNAHVTSGGLDISLLGMSIIDDFSDFRFTNDNLILKY